jgi:hypothetical protein
VFRAEMLTLTANSLRYYTVILLLAGLMGAILPGVHGAEPLPAEEAPRPIAVITHPGNEVPSVTRSELARMFLKKQTAWSNGERCIPIDQRGESTIRREFSRLVLQTTVYEMKRYWIQETMTGNAKPPVSLESASTVKKYVQKLPGAVGYIYLDEVDESVRVLAVTDVADLALPPAKDDTTERDRPTDQTDRTDPADGPGATPDSAYPAPEGDRPAPPGDASP